jgi:hypothetical protein
VTSTYTVAVAVLTETKDKLKVVKLILVVLNHQVITVVTTILTGVKVMLHQALVAVVNGLPTLVVVMDVQACA